MRQVCLGAFLGFYFAPSHALELNDLSSSLCSRELTYQPAIQVMADTAPVTSWQVLKWGSG